MDKVVILDRNNQTGFILNHSIDNSTFTYTFQKNSERQLDFTVSNDGSAAVQLITNENLILFNGQYYVITLPSATNQPGSGTTQVTAIHIGYRANTFRVANADVTTPGSYKPGDVLAHYFNGNDQGYSYSVVGDFSTQKLDSLTKGTGKAGLDLVAQTWPSAILYPDNKRWTVYDSDHWYHKTGKQFTFGKNLTEVDLQPDSNDSIINIIEAYGSPAQSQEDDNSSSETAYNTHVEYRNDDSIAKWGPRPQEDDYTTDQQVSADQLMGMVAATAHPNPTVQATFNYDGEEPISESEVWYMNNPRDHYETSAKITGLTRYPLDPSQAAQLTIDDSQETMLDFDLSVSRTGQQALQYAKEASSKANAVGNSELTFRKVGED